MIPREGGWCLWLLRAAIFSFTLMLTAQTWAVQRKSAPATQAAPETVFVGFYINDIYELDLKRSTYVADFYVWLRWHGAVDPTNFEFLNGSLDLREHPDFTESAGEKYVSYHCRGTFHAALDYRRYPLDEHELVIEMEDANSECSTLQYAIDYNNISRLSPPALVGWSCQSPQFEVRSQIYETNFGDPTQSSDSSSAYSRLYCTVRIERRSFSIYVKTFLGLFISVAIAFLAFLLKPAESDPRFGVGIAAIFGAVSSEIVVTSNLPDMPYLTLADKIHLFSLFVIFLTLLVSCLSLRLVREKRVAMATRIDRVSLIMFPVAYAAVILVLTFVR